MTNPYALLLAAIAMWVAACGDGHDPFDEDDNGRWGPAVQYAVFPGGKYEETDGGMLCAVRTRHYAIDATFEVRDDAEGELNECVPSCGPQRWGIQRKLSIESLPAGACTKDPPCHMGAYVPCPCDLNSGPVNGYRCSCRGGEWTCLNVSQGGAICPCEGDPGTD